MISQSRDLDQVQNIQGLDERSNLLSCKIIAKIILLLFLIYRSLLQIYTGTSITTSWFSIKPRHVPTSWFQLHGAQTLFSQLRKTKNVRREEKKLNEKIVLCQKIEKLFRVKPKIFAVQRVYIGCLEGEKSGIALEVERYHQRQTSWWSNGFTVQL